VEAVRAIRLAVANPIPEALTHHSILAIKSIKLKVICVRNVDVTIPFEGEEDSLPAARATKENKYSSL